MTATPAQEATASGDPPPWDAFISYAHEDLAAAMWVRKVLERHRVEGRDIRRVFLDREELTTVGVLPERLSTALDRSHHLVVLASRHSAASSWVGKELRHFVARHGWGHVHVCRIGAPGDDALPADYVVRYPDEAGRPHVPDLRGGSWRRGRRLRQVMPVLASVAGLDSPAQLLRALRNRRRTWIALVASLVVIALSWSAARAAWRDTVWHAQEASLRALVQDAERQRLDDHQVFEALRLLVVLDRPHAAEGVISFLPEGVLRTLARAQLAADRPVPACDAARRQAAAVHAAYLQRYALAPTIVAARCNQPRIERPAQTDRDDLVSSVRLLLRAGETARADELVRAAPAPTRLHLELAASLESREVERLSRIAPTRGVQRRS